MLLSDLGSQRLDFIHELLVTCWVVAILLQLVGDLLACDQGLRLGTCVHLMLLNFELLPGQALVKLAKAFVLLILFVDASLVPHFQNTVHCHPKISKLRHNLSQLDEGVADLSALLLGKQQNLVGSLDELLAFGPRI